jgi:tRNA threonylcarbamoyladenosine biosynthesis protein TsaE
VAAGIIRSLRAVPSRRSESAADTVELGRRLGLALAPGDVVTLSGPFGAGKTTLVQGIGLGLGVSESVSSPSFALVNEYVPGTSGSRLPFFHLDLYRVRDPLEIDELDLDAYFARGGAMAIEWPELALDLLPADRIDLVLRLEGDARILELRTSGPRGARLAGAMVAA